MPRIQQLPNALINQIAAGEVIERPASVVKEIVENAIDADATQIQIDIEEAGSKLIRVRDNGSGIHPEDLALAFSTHATSKIRSFEDLEHVRTLGFRGEALPSIASVSKTLLTSRFEANDHAYKIAPYISMDISPAAHPQGTTIEIRDLFYNTPARKKFLKSERTERQHITQLLERIALSHSHVQFTLNNHGKLLAQYSGDNPEARVTSVLGEDFLEQAVPIDAQNGDMRLWGWVGLPTYHHLNADKQYFFINGRTIRDKIIAHAIKQAYQDVLYHGRQPIFVLQLDIPPELIDVNAHPQKQEVRYREARLTHDFLYSTINHALRAVRPTTAPTATSETSAKVISEQPVKPSTPRQQTSFQYTTSPTRTTRHQLNETRTYYQWASQTQAPPAPAPLSSISTLPNLEPESQTEEHPLGYALGQVHGIFILAENANGLVIVDMHAAHERILYEKMKAQLAQKAVGESQKLLIAQTLPISAAQEEALTEQTEWLKQLGYRWRIEAGELLIDAVPALLKKVNHL